MTVRITDDNAWELLVEMEGESYRRDGPTPQFFLNYFHFNT